MTKITRYVGKKALSVHKLIIGVGVHKGLTGRPETKGQGTAGSATYERDQSS